MRLKQIIESRGVAISQDMAVKAVKKQCSSALKAFRDDKIIWRGVGNQDVGKSDFIFIKPSASQRVSANTHNLYTLVIDGSSKWKQYPDRGKSIICTTDKYNADNYGKPFIVLPVNGYTFGVCPEDDMWASFENTIGGRLDDFNEEVGELLSEMDIEYHLYNQLKTQSDLKSLVKLMDKAFDESGISEERFDWLREYDGSFLKLFEELLDPGKNGFEIIKNIKNIPVSEREVWTDSDSFLVSSSWIAKNERLLFV